MTFRTFYAPLYKLGVTLGAHPVHIADDGEKVPSSLPSVYDNNAIDCPQKPRVQPATTLESVIESSSRSLLNLWLVSGAPGMTISVAKEGKILWNYAIGYCDVENQVLCLPDAKMRIASISKSMFSATMVAPLLEKQKLTLESTVHQFLTTSEFPKPKFKGTEYDITVQQLLSHTSGITHYGKYKSEDRKLSPIASKGSQKIYQDEEQVKNVGFYQRKRFRSVLEALEPFKEKELVVKPGQFYYTTYGYTLLSAVVEKALQQSGDLKDQQLEDHWQKVLHHDWELDKTWLDQNEMVLSKRARHYMRSGINGSLINAPIVDNSIKWAGGGLVSTAQDMVKFASKLVDSYKERPNAKLKRGTIELLWREVQQSYGLGFAIRHLGTEPENVDKFAIYHTGEASGGSSVVVILPESEVVVAILVNLNSVDAKTVGINIAKSFARL